MQCRPTLPQVLSSLCQTDHGRGECRENPDDLSVGLREGVAIAAVEADHPEALPGTGSLDRQPQAQRTARRVGIGRRSQEALALPGEIRHIHWGPAAQRRNQRTPPRSWNWIASRVSALSSVATWGPTSVLATSQIDAQATPDRTHHESQQAQQARRQGGLRDQFLGQ